MRHKHHLLRLLSFSSSSARALEHLLEAVLAVRVRLLQVVLLLVQIRHLSLQSRLLCAQSLLHIWNWCANEPVDVSIRFHRFLETSTRVPAQPCWEVGLKSCCFDLHFPHALVDFRLLGKYLDFARCQLQHAAFTGARCFLLSYNEQLLLSKSLLLANFLQNLGRSVSAVCRLRGDSTHFLQRFVWHRHCERDIRIWTFWW